MKLKCMALAILFLLVAGLPTIQSQVVINEFLASNGQILADDDGEFSDWIEIHNRGASAVNLQEWSLTDDPSNPRKWEFPFLNLPANGYVVVFASGKNRNSPKLHTNFSLNVDGEYLALFRPDETIASEFAPEFPGQQRDISYGYDNTGSLVFFTPPTPGAANSGGGAINFVADTKFSHDRGFYEIGFELTITTATPGATIRYTADGTPPTAIAGEVYSGPIPINGTTVIRAAAFLAGYQPSNVDTHTYIFLGDVIRQSPGGSPPPGWPSSWGANTVDYGMDPEVVDSPLYRDTIKEDLKTIPSFSVVMRLGDLFDPTTGIYANPHQDGRSWERPCSLELIYPDGTEGFQIDAGIRIRGGFSRSTSNPKHAFRFFFRDEYGAGKLEYPMFGNNGTDRFDGIDLRTFQNYSWSFQGASSGSQGVFLRDQFSRDTQFEMGHHAERGDFYHLYINGQYFGLYNICERPEASYAESYYGGSKEDYDVIKVESGPYTINATDGNMNAWTELYNLALGGFATDAAYQRVLGNDPEGTPNPAYPVLIDVPNLIDYMLVIIYGGNKDAPISNFLGNTSPNNFFGLRNRNIEARQGFQFFSHDAEHTLLTGDLNIDRTGPFPAGDSSVAKSNPQWIFQKLWAHPEFRLKTADHIHRHFFNGGLLTPEKNRERFLRRKNEIDRAVVGESARWGDAKRSNPYTRNVEWVNAINGILNNYFPTRSDIVLNQLRGDGLYPSVTAPSFNQHGGPVNAGFSLTLSAPAGTIYYTTDGSDPRLWGGEVSASAREYNSALTVNETTQVKARVRQGSAWSALNEATFTVIQTFRELMITEIMYHPADEGTTDGDEFEFIELKNVGSSELDLSGVAFTNGISFRFPNGTRLSPGNFMVLVANADSFPTRYPTVRIDGVYTNNLSNGGERIALVHATGAPLQSFVYNDAAPWPTSADGSGFSLVPVSYDLNADYNNPVFWRASSRIGGSPGQDDPPVDIPTVVINEVLTHTDPPMLDSVEVFNPTPETADISGWFLTDRIGIPKKFKIPLGASIPSGGYMIFDEADFNPNPGVDPSFNLSSHGEEIYLFSANAAEELTGYVTGFAFGAALNGVSFGRYTNSIGEVFHPAQTQVTIGQANSGPRVGPVVINEIRYAPRLGEEEFIELKNITGQAVKLHDQNNPANTWRLNGIGFSFPQSIEIPASGIVVISATDPGSFRTRNNVPAQVQIFGPYTGQLQDNGENLELLMSDTPDIVNGQEIVPYVVVDAVRYDNNPPWPTEAAGNGHSLERINPAAFGNDPQNWRASPGPASPGLNNDGNRLPVVNAGNDVEILTGTFPFTTNRTATATDDGLPNPPAQLTHAWTQFSGPGEVLIDNADQLDTTFHFPGVGVYTLRLTVSDSEYTATDDVVVTISRPLSQQTLISTGSVWKYLDDGSDQGTTWRGVSFNDSGWQSGAAQLGYGDNDEVTVVGYGPDQSNKYTTTYYRHSFDLPNAAIVNSLSVRLMRDDGAIVYLNGQEVFRSNMPEGAVDYLTRASSVVGGGDESAFFTSEIDPSLLQDGNNVIAVEVHQENGGSSDTSFDLELTGLVDFSNEPPVANAGPDQVLSEGNIAQLEGEATDDGLPNPPGVYSASWSVISAPGSVSFENANSLRTSVSFGVAGVYQLRLTVTDGQLNDSDDLQVTVEGIDPYAEWASQHFTSEEAGDPLISGPHADPDGDGFSNEQEFIAGTDPRDPTSYLHVEAVYLEDGRLVIRFEAVGGKAYTVFGRDDLQGSSWERVLDLSPQATTEMIEVADPAQGSQPRRFYRLATPEQPLAP